MSADCIAIDSLTFKSEFSGLKTGGPLTGS
jgi:hypothetical protein